MSIACMSMYDICFIMYDQCWSLILSWPLTVLPSKWFSPCVHPCTPRFHLFGWHLKQVTLIPRCILSIFRVHFVHFSNSPSRLTQTLWNEYQIKTTHISTQDINFGPQKCSSAENLKNGQIIILSSFPRTSQKIGCKINFWQ